MKRRLSIDIETFSEEDISKVGSYKYIGSPSFEILLFAYAYDDEPVKVIDLAQGEEIPQNVLGDLFNENVIKCAFNDNFERIALSKYLWCLKITDFNASPVNLWGHCADSKFYDKYLLPVEQWECTMIKSLALGLPGSLKGVCNALGFGEEGKMDVGKKLINYFCKPCKPTKVNGGRTRNLPEHDLEGWNTFKEYNIRDVEVERRVRKLVDNYPLNNGKWNEWLIRKVDQDIVDRGVRLNSKLADNAVRMSAQYSEQQLERAKEITGLENPNSVTQLRLWVNHRLGYPVPTLRKDDIKRLLETDLPGDVREALEIRLRLGKTSIKKYQTMLECVCADGRMHGLLQHYGANRTGRWRGRLVQVQNLPQNKIKEIEYANHLRNIGDSETLDKEFDGLPFVLSQLVRTAFIPKDHYKFMVADFSAIEARVIRWLAGEQWRLDVFNTHGKIYEASASQMFGVPVESIKKGDPLRQKGKIAELRLGYGGSVGALEAMGALNMGLSKDDLKPLVDAWRASNPHITELWWAVDEAAKTAIDEKTTVRLEQYNLTFKYTHQLLRVELPSGRFLTYCKPRLGPGKFGTLNITYEGVNQTTKKWERIFTYGPKLVENIVQGIARDCLAEAMINVSNQGYEIVMHVHDEIIAEVPRSPHYAIQSLDEMIDLMCIVPTWAQGLPLKADGYECNFYMKD